MNNSSLRTNPHKEFIRTFFKEKDIPRQVITVTYDGQNHYMESEDFIHYLLEEVPEDVQKTIEIHLRHIDYYDRCVFSYLEDIYYGLVEAQYSVQNKTSTFT